MRYEDMYEKPIDRPIDAVVKASSVEYLANELDEYVITPNSRAISAASSTSTTTPTPLATERGLRASSAAASLTC